MEQINYKEEAKNWLKDYDLENSSFDIEESHSDFAKYIAEEIYSKQLEEKDALCQRLQERRSEIQSEAERLKQELQKAKELLTQSLKYINEADHISGWKELHKNIQKFLAK